MIDVVIVSLQAVTEYTPRKPVGYAGVVRASRDPPNTVYVMPADRRISGDSPSENQAADEKISVRITKRRT